MSDVEKLRQLRADATRAHFAWWFSGLPSARSIAPLWRCLAWASAL